MIKSRCRTVPSPQKNYCVALFIHILHTVLLYPVFYALGTTSLFSIILSVWKCYKNGITQYVILWDRLFLLDKIPLKSIQVLAFPNSSFIFMMSCIPLFWCTRIHSAFTLWRKLDCFQSFAITNEAAMNIVYRFCMTIVLWYISFNVSSKYSLSISFLFCTTRYSKIIFYFLTVLESALAPRDPGSFNGKWYLETKICMLPVLVATGVSLLPSFFSTQSLEKRDINKEWVNTYIKIHLYLYPFLYPILTQYHRVHSVSTHFHIYNSLSQHSETWLTLFACKFGILYLSVDQGFLTLSLVIFWCQIILLWGTGRGQPLCIVGC